MDFWAKLIFIVIIGHFMVGFGYLTFKLSPKKKRDVEETLDQKADE